MLRKLGNGCCLADKLGVSAQVPRSAHHWPITGQRGRSTRPRCPHSSSKCFIALTACHQRRSSVTDVCVVLKLVQDLASWD